MKKLFYLFVLLAEGGQDHQVEPESLSRSESHAMPAEGRKPRSHSVRPVRRRTSRRRAASVKSSCAEVDILSPAAMKNAYYISHNAMDCLEFRGFGGWQEERQASQEAQEQKITVITLHVKQRHYN
ncbi:hypothetical protein AALO_G00218040 [Alosa alosa]|uniref:Secreted protein n=1 Tax=Alosa alosa TaxID=278164 RepID=A0AAV6FWA4_9TELE|nr:hypothetical protein AALO_G00218040 [Alosa alosa]